MEKGKVKTIRVSAETWTRLMKIKTEAMLTSIDDVVVLILGRRAVK